MHKMLGMTAGIKKRGLSPRTALKQHPWAMLSIAFGHAVTTAFEDSRHAGCTVPSNRAQQRAAAWPVVHPRRERTLYSQIRRLGEDIWTCWEAVAVVSSLEASIARTAGCGQTAVHRV